MGKRIQLFSDLSGDDGAKTRVLGVDKIWYEIDLTDDEYQELLQALSRYLPEQAGGSGPARLHEPSKPKVKRAKVPYVPPSYRPPLPKTSPGDRRSIRTWWSGLTAKERIFWAQDPTAGESGYVRELGRVPERLFRAYDRAHGTNLSAVFDDNPNSKHRLLVVPDPTLKQGGAAVGRLAAVPDPSSKKRTR